MALFATGTLVATPGALEALGRVSQSPGELVTKHVRGEWGDLGADDQEQNRTALRDGGRILSSYKTRLGDVVWVITEADRSSTCILLPEDCASCHDAD
jgi:hypothetical protein